MVGIGRLSQYPTSPTTHTPTQHQHPPTPQPPQCEEAGAAARIPRESAFPPAPDHIRAAGRNQRYKLLAHSLAPFVGGPDAFAQASWTKEGARAGYEPCKWKGRGNGGVWGGGRRGSDRLIIITIQNNATPRTGEDAWAAAYLNRKDVQDAIHAKPYVPVCVLLFVGGVGISTHIPLQLHAPHGSPISHTIHTHQKRDTAPQPPGEQRAVGGLLRRGLLLLQPRGPPRLHAAHLQLPPVRACAGICLPACLCVWIASCVLPAPAHVCVSIRADLPILTPTPTQPHTKTGRTRRSWGCRSWSSPGTTTPSARRRARGSGSPTCPGPWPRARSGWPGMCVRWVVSVY